MNEQRKTDLAVICSSQSERGVLRSAWLGGTLIFVVLTGLVIWLLRFGVTAQVAVLFHTAAGLVVLIPLSLWLLRHWIATRKAARSASKLSAYVGFWVLAASIVSGLVITYQAAFKIAVSHGWAAAHLWTSVLALPFVVFHAFPRKAHENETRDPARDATRTSGRPRWKRSFVVVILLFAAMAGASALYHAPDFGGYKPPASFRAAPGPNPFAPSNAQMEGNAPVPSEVISRSHACGAPGCHTTIYEEWRASAHRWSQEDQFFQSVRSATTEVQGVHATEKCGGCHAPVTMLSGYKDPRLGTSVPGYAEGDSCVVCHAVRHVDERGIGSYVLGIAKPYLYEYSDARYASFVNHFLIRVYPEQHDRDYNLTIARQAESCAPCHKEYDEVGKYPGLLQVETQYDDWKQQKWNTDRDPARRLRCQQCHMYIRRARNLELADPYDLAIGLGVEYHNHRFAAANQFMPEAIQTPGAEEQIQDVERWLTGKRLVPEIQKAWPRGPIVPLRIEAPSSVRPGGSVAMQVVLTNQKAGHSFPTGPLNVVRVWIDLQVRDAKGKEVFHSGGLDRQNHVEAGSYVLRPIAITESGESILTPDIWHPKGLKFRPAIPPGKSEILDYCFSIPRGVLGPLVIHARLRYRKANQFFMDAVYTERHEEAPVTDISAATAEIAVVGGPAGRSDPNQLP